MVIHEDFPIASVLWYKIGGTVKYLLDVSSVDDLLEALAFVKESSIKKVFVIGTGANLLFTDDYFDGAVLRFIPTTHHDIAFTKDGEVTAFSGELLDTVIQEGFKRNMIGLQWAGGLPGTVGAAVRGNVGAFGGELQHLFIEAAIVDLHDVEKKIRNYSREEMEFVYRGSVVKEHKNLLIISATLKLSLDDSIEEAKKKYAEHIAYRKNNHPLEYPNTGSVFKNIEDPRNIQKVIEKHPELKETIEGKWHGKVSAGFLITQMGFREYQVGKAQVSTKHANFINNLGGARSEDVLSIIDAIQKQCEEDYGFRLEPEVEIVV